MLASDQKSSYQQFLSGVWCHFSRSIYQTTKSYMKILELFFKYIPHPPGSERLLMMQKTYICVWKVLQLLVLFRTSGPLSVKAFWLCVAAAIHFSCFSRILMEVLTRSQLQKNLFRGNKRTQ